MTLRSSVFDTEREKRSSRPISMDLVSRIPARIRDKWIAARNRLLADTRFQRWAADFPLTRGIARGHALALFDLVAGFVYSQTLSTCVDVGLFDCLRERPQTISALAQSLGLPTQAAQRLCRAAMALGLVEEVSGGRYALGPKGAALLGNAGLVEMIRHHRLFYADLIDGVEPLRRNDDRGNLASYWPYATSTSPEHASPESVAAYSALMAASQPSVSEDILHAYDLSRHRRLMDVGGGEGAFLKSVGLRVPGLDLRLFDLPAVAERAKEALGRAGLQSRAEIFSGNFLCEPLPKGSDIITLIRILHDHSDEGALTLLTSARAALPINGALLIAEPMSAAPSQDRVADVYFAFYLLAMGRGRARTPTEIIALTRAAGFRQARTLNTRSPFLLRVIVASP